MHVANDRALQAIWPGGPRSEANPLSSPLEVHDQAFVLVAGALLADHSHDALAVDGGSPPHLVGGYSILSNLLETSEPYRFLFRKAGTLIAPSSPLPAEARLETLLERFAASGFGHALVAFPGGPRIISLTNLIELYRQGKLETPLTCAEVASAPLPPISPTATLEEAAKAMMKSRVRRLLVEGEGRAIITDRMLIGAFFSPEALEWIGEHPDRLPPLSVDSLRPIALVEIEGALRIPKAVRLFDPQSGQALRCDQGIVTPWDLVMKPFERGALSLR